MGVCILLGAKGRLTLINVKQLLITLKKNLWTIYQRTKTQEKKQMDSDGVWL